MGEAGWPFSQEAFLESDAWFEVRVLAIKAEVRHLHYKKERKNCQDLHCTVLSILLLH